ncbi:hypothetical protein VT84_19615 [Gemmata sp. SH-PL17]|uniref:hypothetical protein n=1 Tax=Gemmata sp. SH-PL17 TaxID=1630693 RepID=UPI00078B3D82|nr:hypothetical protein [Gemmata sp. SH-PL17]AMV26616.1 hypothetical protein VT84_19615 [Gemmata sp. SH-PL17]
MTTLTCPKCRQGMPETALDTGQCPACGFPLEGPVVLNEQQRQESRPFPVLILSIAVGVLAIGTYAYFKRPEIPPRNLPPERPPVTPEQESAVAKHILPFTPSSLTNNAPRSERGAPNPADPSSTVDDKNAQERTAVVEPKKETQRPTGAVMKIDPKIAPKRDFDNPDDTATLPDLATGDRVTLTGKLRVLKIGSVNGKASIDATGLVAEEIVISGDLNGEAVVQLNAPNGKVTIGGYVGGSSKITIVAPGGEVIVLESSGRLTDRSTTVVTAKRLEIAGKMLGNSRLVATLTTDGLLKVTAAEDNATLTYKKAAESDPPITIEKGAIRGGAKVIGE